MISKRIFFILCFIFSSILSYADNEKIKPEFQNEEETLFFRRIVEFFEEGEYELVKDQLKFFLEENTKSPLVSYFNAFLGDIYMREEGFEKALSCYTKILDQKIKEKIELNLLQCFYELKFYDELKDECLDFLKTNKDSTHSTRINFLLAEAFYQKASLNNFENSEDNLENAKKYFNQLISTDYEDDTMITLCHIHHLLKEHNLASNLYLDLAQKNETKRAKYLFSAAKEQAYFDKELAIKTLNIIIKLKSGKEKEAEFEKLLILFDSKNYKEIVLCKDNVSLPDGKYYLLHFFVGRSHFFLKHFDESKKELFKFIKKENQSTKFLEIGLLTLMQIAEETNDPKIFSDAFNIFNNKFDENENLSKSLQVKASLLKKNKLYDEAEADFFRLENQFKIKTEEFNYEYAHLLYLKKSYEKAREKFKNFIKKFGKSPLTPTAWRFLINSSIYSVNQTQDENVKSARLLLIENLYKYLDQTSIITQHEIEDVQFLIGTTYYDLENYEFVKKHFDTFIEQYPNSKNIQTAHVILAYSLKNTNWTGQFCERAKIALQFDLDIFTRKSLLINLFNSYIELGNRDKYYREKNLSLAADNLYEALKIDTENSISENNLDWLSDYYYFQIKPALEYKFERTEDFINYYDRSKFTVEKILSKINFSKLEDKNPILYEKELLKFANLLSLRDTKKQISILTLLIEKYKTLPNIKWEGKDQTFYDLSTAYVSTKNLEKAKLFLTETINLTKNGSFYNVKARFANVMLRLNQLSKKNKKIENFINELKELKTLTLIKKISSEPTHLEAALEYIDLQCLIENQKDLLEKRIFLLKKIKNDFLQDSDIAAQDYHYEKSINKEKKFIFNCYIAYMNTEIAVYQYIKEKRSDGDNLAEHKENANKSISRLVKEKLICSSYLRARFDKLLKIADLKVYDDEKE